MKTKSAFKQIIEELKSDETKLTPVLAFKIHDIIKKNFPDSDIIKEYPLASAFYHFLSKAW